MYSEKTLRKRANRIGYKIQKGRVKVGNHYLLGGGVGYSVIDTEYNCIVYGNNGTLLNILTLKDVDEFLHDQYIELGLKF